MMRRMGGSNSQRWLYGVLVVGGIGVLLSVTLMGRSAFAGAGPKPEIHRQARHPGQSAPSAPSGQSAQQQTATGGTCPRAGWNVTPSQNPGTLNTFKAVSAVSATDAWAVGNDNPAPPGSGQEPLAEHFDGHQWTTTTVPLDASATSAELEGVAARASNDVWAVGSQFGATLVERWDGSQWKVVASPNHGSDPSFLLDVTATSATDAWAVGAHSFNGNNTNGPLITHWDGTAWTEVTGADTGLPDVELDVIRAASSTNVWVLGHGTDTQSMDQTVVEHWDGQSWTSALLPYVGNNALTPGGLAIAPDGTVWVAGNVTDQTAGHAVPVAMRRENGSGVWTPIPSADVGSLGSGFEDIGISPTGEMWTVGWYALSTGYAPDHVLIERWNGSAFVQWPDGDGTTATQYGNLVSIAVVSRDAALAVGTIGTSNALGQTFAEEYLRTVPLITCSTSG